MREYLNIPQFCIIFFSITNLINSLSVENLDTRGNPRFVVFWTSIFHYSSSSPHPYTDFIDLFVHPVTTMLVGNPPPKLVQILKKFFSYPSSTRLGIGTCTRTILSSEFMGVDFLHINCPNMSP